MTPEAPSSTSSIPGRNPILLCQRCNHEFVGYNTDMLPSILAHLRSNYIPSHLERSQIQYNGIEIQKDLENYAREISRLQKILNQLEEERRIVESHAERLAGLVIPIRRLPTEILGEIFDVLCSPKCKFHPVGNDGDLIQRGPLPLQNVALLLSQTCYFWRSVILSRAELWSAIEVDLGDIDSLGYQFLSLYLQNSKQASLSLSISGTDISRYPVSKQFLAVGTFMLLLNHADRWRSLEISCDRAVFDYMSRYLSRVPVESSHFPRLESLDLSWIEDPEFDISSLKQSLRCFKRLPNLRSLSLSDYTPDCLPLPLLQLSSLSFFSLGGPEHFSILDLCPDIQTLELDAYGHYDLDPLPTRTISLLHLTSLSIEFDRTASFGNFFKNLYVPCLEELKMRDGRKPKRCEWIREAYTKVKERSGFRLKRLEVRGCVLGEGDLMDILKRTPSLERLTFYECQEPPTGIGGEDAEEEEMVQGRSHSGEVVPLIATTKSLLISLASRDVPRLLPSLWMLNITIPTLAIPDYLFPVIETRWIPEETSQSHVATTSDSRSACLGTVTVQVPMRGDRMLIDNDNGSDMGMEIRRRLRDRLDGVLRGGFRLRVDDLKPGT